MNGIVPDVGFIQDRRDRGFLLDCVERDITPEAKASTKQEDIRADLHAGALPDCYEGTGIRIEVWSTREGEERFDTHVDKLLNDIRFWQASGESEKTAIRVRTKHSQMIQEGQWRGGLVPYGYRLEFQGRTNKRNKPVRDLMIDEEEGKVVREIFHLLTEEGFGTNRVAQYLNDRGIKTKRGTTLWRGTSIELEGIENGIVLNSVIQKAYQGEALLNEKMEGDFPVLKPGNNLISWSGDVSRLVIAPNWRFL